MTHDAEFDPDEDEAWDVDPNPEMVRWQPTHSPDAIESFPARVTSASALGVIAVASTVFGALAIGALAIGALAVGRLVVGRASFRTVEIDELIVGRVRFKDDD